MTRRRKNQSGSTIIELGIVLPGLTLIFFGTVGLGIMLGRHVQAVQLCRDVAHMYADGVDFSLTAGKNIVTQKLAAGTGMTNTGGNGVVILSKIITVYLSDCTASGLTSTQCANAGLPVITHRIVIGDPALRNSRYGTPAATLDAAGNVSPATTYMTNSADTRATNFEADLDAAVLRATGSAPTPPAQTQGETAYAVETFFKYPDIGFLGWSTAGGAYAKFVFR